MGSTRILTIAALAMGLGALGAAPAVAGDGAKPKLAKDDTSRRVCKNIVRVGTRLSTRICRTEADWASSMDKAQDNHLKSQMKDQTLYEQAAGPR